MFQLKAKITVVVATALTGTSLVLASSVGAATNPPPPPPPAAGAPADLPVVSPPSGLPAVDANDRPGQSQPSAAYTVSYRSGGAQCGITGNGRTVTAHPPMPGWGIMTSWYGGRETVYWTSVLQRYSNGYWYTVDNSRPWLTGAADARGQLFFPIGSYYWTSTQTGWKLEHHEYSGLYSGYYRVVEYFYWRASGVTRALLTSVYNSRSASYCTL